MSVSEQPIAEEQALALLQSGEMTLEGLVSWSSNYTFVVTLRDQELAALAIYKPSAGEQPLWDFAAGTLCRREVASYVLSRYLGWPDIPPVLLRDGVHGPGSVQLWVSAEPEGHFFTVRGKSEFDTALRRIALFDWLVNNADRKGGHVLPGTAGTLWAIDHGLTFHVDYRLRTVIWDYAGEAIGDGERADIEALLSTLSRVDEPLCLALGALLSSAELTALRRRARALLRGGRFPLPREDWRNVPYPLI
jgi:uncharacterized repeat protein (TIGR03843 family)